MGKAADTWCKMSQERSRSANSEDNMQRSSATREHWPAEKPVSLHRLSFKEALRDLLRTKPEHRDNPRHQDNDDDSV